ncbi:MAG: PHP domain-containing protein, partial [Candidatus Omnitrophica bacterium]|nr:PHP domain-containing protein [Candidatus Omnitrophota bacterium]
MVNQLPGRATVYLCSPTCAGKTTYAEVLQNDLGQMQRRAVVLNGDAYHKPWGLRPKDASGRYLDHPDALHIDWMRENIRLLLSGAEVDLPSYDFMTHLSVRHSGRREHLGPDDILIIDSHFAFADRLLEVSQGYPSLRVFLDAPLGIRLVRRMGRELLLGDTLEKILSRWETVIIGERNIIYPSRIKADLVFVFIPTEREEVLERRRVTMALSQAGKIDALESIILAEDSKPAREKDWHLLAEAVAARNRLGASNNAVVHDVYQRDLKWLPLDKGRRDLHIHTQICDGGLPLEDVIKIAVRDVVKVIAITEHDALEGVKMAVEIGRRYGIMVIPSVELGFYCEVDQVLHSGVDVHILPYGIDSDNRGLQKLVNDRVKKQQLRRFTDLYVKLAFLKNIGNENGVCSALAHLRPLASIFAEGALDMGRILSQLLFVINDEYQEIYLRNGLNEAARKIEAGKTRILEMGPEFFALIQRIADTATPYQLSVEENDLLDSLILFQTSSASPTGEEFVEIVNGLVKQSGQKVGLRGYTYNDGIPGLPLMENRPEEIFRVITAAGGVGIFAHPKWYPFVLFPVMQNPLPLEEGFAFIRGILAQCFEKGAAGVEGQTFHLNRTYDPQFIELARNQNKLVTAGTDSHMLLGSGSKIHTELALGVDNTFYMGSFDLNALLTAMAKNPEKRFQYNAAIAPQPKYEAFQPAQVRVSFANGYANLEVLQRGSLTDGQEHILQRRLEEMLAHQPDALSAVIWITPQTSVVEHNSFAPRKSIIISEYLPESKEIRLYPVFLESDEGLASLFRVTLQEARRFLITALIDEFGHAEGLNQQEGDAQTLEWLMYHPEYLFANIAVLNPYAAYAAHIIEPVGDWLTKLCSGLLATEIEHFQSRRHRLIYQDIKDLKSWQKEKGRFTPSSPQKFKESEFTLLNAEPVVQEAINLTRNVTVMLPFGLGECSIYGFLSTAQVIWVSGEYYGRDEVYYEASGNIIYLLSKYNKSEVISRGLFTPLRLAKQLIHAAIEAAIRERMVDFWNEAVEQFTHNFASRVLLEQRELLMPAGIDLFASLQHLWLCQLSATILKEDGTRDTFFRILEDGNTVDYAVIKGDGSLESCSVAHLGGKLEGAVAVAIQNRGRGKRPGAAKAGGSRLTEEGEKSPRDIIPGHMEEKYPLELWLSWQAPSGQIWRFTLNPFAIWPNNPNLSDEEQPYQCTVSRGDARVYQREMGEADNLSDMLHLFLQLNHSTSILGREKFRIGINGWYYLDADDSPKAGATQSQAHAHIVRFPFPIEKAELAPRYNVGAVNVSTLKDSAFGTATVLEAEEKELPSLLALSQKVVEACIFYGNSFNVLITPVNTPSYIKIFVFARRLGIPQPYFMNEWGFAEMGRAIVIDDLSYFYDLTEAQRQELSSGQEKPDIWLRRHKLLADLKVKPTLFEDVKNSLVICTTSVAENARMIDAALYHAKPRSQSTLLNIPVEWEKAFETIEKNVVDDYRDSLPEDVTRTTRLVTLHTPAQLFSQGQLAQMQEMLQTGEIVRKIQIYTNLSYTFEKSHSDWDGPFGPRGDYDQYFHLATVQIRLLLADGKTVLVCQEEKTASTAYEMSTVIIPLISELRGIQVRNLRGEGDTTHQYPAAIAPQAEYEGFQPARARVSFTNGQAHLEVLQRGSLTDDQEHILQRRLEEMFAHLPNAPPATIWVTPNTTLIDGRRIISEFSPLTSEVSLYPIFVETDETLSPILNVT